MTGASAGRGVAALEKGLQARGLEASPQLLALYRQWLTEGGEVTMMLAPGSETFGLPVRTDSENSASLRVSYNGATVPDVYLTEMQRVEPLEEIMCILATNLAEPKA